MAHFSRICTKTLMSTWPHAWVPTPKITSFADPQSAHLGPSLPTGERPDRGPWSVTPCHPGDTACSTVIARRSALVVAARSERWRRTRRVSEHHRHPRGRRRRDVGRHRCNLPRCARRCRQQLRVAVNARWQRPQRWWVEAMMQQCSWLLSPRPRRRSSDRRARRLPSFLSPAVGIRMAPTLQQVPPMRRSDARRGRWHLEWALSCLAIVASCATIEFSNLWHLADWFACLPLCLICRYPC